MCGKFLGLKKWLENARKFIQPTLCTVKFFVLFFLMHKKLAKHSLKFFFANFKIFFWENEYFFQRG